MQKAGHPRDLLAQVSIMIQETILSNFHRPPHLLAKERVDFVIKSRFTRSNPSSEIRTSNLNKEFQPSTLKCKRQLRSFARTQHEGGKSTGGTPGRGKNPQTCSCYVADCETQSCSILNLMTLKLPRANV